MISTSTMTMLFATLAILAAVAAVVLHAVRWLPLPEARRSVARLLDGQEVQLAFVVALVATLGSLYLSEVAHFVPCRLCWYQRIAMYPLVVILGIAAIRDDPGVTRYAAPVAAIGALLSIWHIGVERIPGIPSGACSLDVPCSLIYVERFGFVTIPTMALFGFLAILTLLLVYARGGRSTQPEPESTA